MSAVEHADADRRIAALYANKAAWNARDRAQDAKLSACFATLADSPDTSAAFCRLLYGNRGTARMATIEPVDPHIGTVRGNTGLDALLHIARFQNEWLREPEKWTPHTGTLATKVASLMRHLFALYEVPAFLDAAWLSGMGDEAQAYRRWWVHLAQGEKLEAIRFPMPMTHRAAHYFLTAPPTFPIPAALRWGQIKSLGGREATANAVAESFLRGLQADEPFWGTVTAFLVQKSIPTWQVVPLLDYLKYRKDTEPNFAMKGRTPDALFRLMDEWHETLARLKTPPAQAWEPSHIQNWDETEDDILSNAVCRWQITELTNGLSLLKEGREMRHCVTTYQEKAVRGEISIHSLRLTLSDNPHVTRPLLTLEVNTAGRAIVQARGKCNQSLAQMRGNRRMMQAKHILREWARRERLAIACAL